MEKKGKIGDLLQRRMSNEIGHGAKGYRKDVGVMSRHDIQTDLRMGMSQRGRPWVEMKAVGHGVLESGRTGRLKIQFWKSFPLPSSHLWLRC